MPGRKNIDTEISTLINAIKYNWSSTLQGMTKYQCATRLGEYRGAAHRFVPEIQEMIMTEGDSQLVVILIESLEMISPERYKTLDKEINFNEIKSHIRKVPIKQKSYSYGRNTKNEDDSGMPETPIELEIELVKPKELSTNLKTYRKCNFCEQEILVQSNQALEYMNPPGGFYCAFCLRNHLHTRRSRDIMMLSFRAIFGFFYYELFLLPKQPYMYISEIYEHINFHVEIGNRNPVFTYNELTCCWALDFNRIGHSKKKVPVKVVLRTICEILAGLNLTYNVRDIKLTPLYEKYEEAVTKFYQKRYRPDKMRLCIPTLKGCGNIAWSTTATNPITGGKFTPEDTKRFNTALLAEAYPQQRLNPF